ncbi:MAG: GTPase ObgE [Candidatus Pacebacteria bacterium]|nr:GTPase ObgE [Candidatus Paceibacterota bacterium]
MALIDEFKFHAKAGRGGDGVVRWRREKFIEKGGPAGGNGGRGGDVYIMAVRDNQLLAQYRHIIEFTAKDGVAGGSRSLHGANGDDFTIKLPIGSILTNTETGEKIQLLNEGEKIKILEGGGGGKGNEHFKSSTNVSPLDWTPGREGQEADYHVELEIIADIGLIGLPNAGKSSLLNSITRAKAKVGDYAFTTLDPNLGDLFGYTLADIPGLIEGASEGKGLGVKFLRHIKRTKVLLHLVSFENEMTATGGMMKAYKEVRNELESYGNGLNEKEEIILLTKTDVLPDDEKEKIVVKKLKEFQKLGNTVYTISLYDDSSIKTFGDEILRFLKK